MSWWEPLLVAAASFAAAFLGSAVALAGAVRHARAGRVDRRTLAWMAPPSVAGAFLGGYFGHAVPERPLLAVIAALLVWNGLDLLFDLRAAPKTRRPRLSAVVSGALIGALGGAVGLILGTLRMPALLRSIGLSPHAAAGTNLAVGFFLGVAGFAGHLARLEVGWALLGVSLGGGLPGAWLGAHTTGHLSEQALRRAIGVALVAVAVPIAAAAA